MLGWEGLRMCTEVLSNSPLAQTRSIRGVTGLGGKKTVAGGENGGEAVAVCWASSSCQRAMIRILKTGS